MTKTERTLALKVLLQLITSAVTQTTTPAPPRKGPTSARNVVEEIRRLRLVRSA